MLITAQENVVFDYFDYSPELAEWHTYDQKYDMLWC